MSSNLIFSYCVFISITSASSEVYTAIAHLEKLYKTEALLIEGLEKYIKGQEALVGELKKTMYLFRTLTPVILISLQLLQAEDLHSFSGDLQKLLPTEALLIESLENYIKEQENKIQTLQKYADNYQKQYEQFSKDPDKFVENPINAFSLIRQLSFVWEDIEELAETNSGIEHINNFTSNTNITLPNDEDFAEIALGLSRLYSFYKFNISSFMEGNVRGVSSAQKLNSEDLYYIGKFACTSGKYYTGLTLLREAFLHSPDDIPFKIKVLEHMAYCSYNVKFVYVALGFINKILELDEGHKRAKLNKGYFEDLLRESGDLNMMKDDLQLEPFLDYLEKLEYQSFKQLCNDEVNISQKLASKLKCYYRHRDVPYLKIAPFKTEEMHLNPNVLVFHDVLSENEIEHVKSLTASELRRSLTYINGTMKKNQFRTSKQAWVSDDVDQTVNKISRRISDLTGLNMTYSEDFQVLYYGIGDNYYPHYDVIKTVFDYNEEIRLATFLLYMNDVIGGNTAFPDIQLSVKAKKGMAVYWPNINDKGEITSSLHGGCPVLHGSKWVMTKWINIKGQKRNCELNPSSIMQL